MIALALTLLLVTSIVALLGAFSLAGVATLAVWIVYGLGLIAVAGAMVRDRST